MSMTKGKMTAATEKKEKAERVFFGCVPKTSCDCSSTTPKYFLNIFIFPRRWGRHFFRPGSVKRLHQRFDRNRRKGYQFDRSP